MTHFVFYYQQIPNRQTAAFFSSPTTEDSGCTQLRLFLLLASHRKMKMFTVYHHIVLNCVVLHSIILHRGRAESKPIDLFVA